MADWVVRNMVCLCVCYTCVCPVRKMGGHCLTGWGKVMNDHHP